MPADAATFMASLLCDPKFATWTYAPVDSNERRPINCVDWHTAFAFCAWDGGRLPTEAEWEYAATGGESRVLPWEVPPAEAAPDITHAIFGCLYNGTGKGWCTGVGNIDPVGSVPLGDARWGQHDMAGNVEEWVLDEAAAYSPAARTNYANLAFVWSRVVRGGGYLYDSPDVLRTTRRNDQRAATRAADVGVRCARGAA